MTYEPRNMELWTTPDYYAGPDFDDHYIAYGQNRDSDALRRSNFTCFLEELGGEDGDRVMVVRQGHWAVGWIELLMIRKDNDEALETADDILDALADYPVVNEEHFSELEWNEAQEYWESLSVRERAEYIKEAGGNIFAARKDYISEAADPSGSLMDRLRD